MLSYDYLCMNLCDGCVFFEQERWGKMLIQPKLIRIFVYLRLVRATRNTVRFAKDFWIGVQHGELFLA